MEETTRNNSVVDDDVDSPPKDDVVEQQQQPTMEATDPPVAADSFVQIESAMESVGNSENVPTEPLPALATVVTTSETVTEHVQSSPKVEISTREALTEGEVRVEELSLATKEESAAEALSEELTPQESTVHEAAPPETSSETTDTANTSKKETEEFKVGAGENQEFTLSEEDSAPTGDGSNNEGRDASTDAPSVDGDQKSAEDDSKNTVPPTSPTDIPIGQSIGAQILMNRFSTWRMTANESAASLLSKTQTNAALQENAKQAQEYALRMRQRFQQTLRVSATKDEEKATGAENKEAATETKKDSQEPEQSGVAVGVSSSSSSGDEGASLERNGSQDSKSTYSSTVGGEEDIFSEATSDGTGTSSNTPYARDRMRAVLNRAGYVMSESVATSFRGRYTADAAAATGTTYGTAKDASEAQSKPVPESQVALILKSRVGEHMQEILNQLESHEYAILLGRGMLGVNLKQCYLKNHGIFVDYLVVGGQAQQSGLIRSGDLLVRLGDTDLRKGTIQEVPHEIAKAKRPSVLVMATGTPVPMERVNYVDVAVAMMHRARKHLQEQKKGGTTLAADKSSDFQQATTSVEDQENVEKEEKCEDLLSASPKSISNVSIPIHDSVEAFVSPPWPNLEIRKEFVDESPLRCHDKFVVSDLCDMLDLDSNFRAAIQNAFLVCALDSRRLPFLARHFSGEEFQVKESSQVESSSSMTPSAELMLFLELASFLDLYEVTPFARLKETASRIAFKFFLPTKIGSRLQPPLFDFHHIAPDSSLRHLEFVLSGKSQTIPKDLFLDFQKSVVNSLTSAPFLSFLCSADCARMRAYLRDTSPFINLPLKPMIDAVCSEIPSGVPRSSGDDNVVGPSKNCLGYTLLYLICRMEKESSGEYDFGLENEENRRLLGTPNDLCCSIFIRRDLLPTLKSTKEKFGSLAEVELPPEAEKLVSMVERFWDLYIADTLEISTKRAEIESSYSQVRKVLEDISRKVFEKFSLPTKECANLILESELEEKATILADELLYEYASNVHTKFRDNKLHEWMCGELCKVVASDPSWYLKMPIPQPPQGCLKRMLRKAELPVGISAHKPYKETKSGDSDRQSHNADWAVVFGSCVGTELASQMPVPGLDNLDVRRYACLPVALDRDHNYDDFRPDEVLPSTFESYAVVPLSKLKPFRSLVDAGRTSVDGWEISLVTFTMPNADSSSSGDATESALFGVSLCFQRLSTDAKGVHQHGKIHTEIKFESQSSDEKNEKELGWKSPIDFEKIVEGNDDAKVIRRIKSSCDLPIFNQRLEGQSWIERVANDEHRDPSQPMVIGIALVSRKNVVFAMRDTLSRLLFDFSRHPGQSLDDAKAAPSCNALVDMLGAFSYQDHEREVLKYLLEPYMRHASSPWVDRPIADQEKAFEIHALKLLTDCLPPIPLALLFVTSLLEQKVVLSSSRRSVLHAASSGLTTLLRPLKWSHLLVPLVPGALAADLIQYPAPFILGVPSEDADNMDLLGNIPRDVTLVDLDVGRVILAPDFGKDNEMVRGTNDATATARALRSQVLYLAQGLGTVFGNSLRPESWLCDGISVASTVASNPSDLDRLRDTARSFVIELLEGTASCCFWFEEATQTYGSASEPTVLFDEDKFFQIKHHRATNAWKHLFPRDKNTGALALNLEDFDLILESFLRCQNLSLHINTLPKTDMFYH